jgi:hypothetical protein
MTTIYSNKIVVSISKTVAGLNIANSQNTATQPGLQIMWQISVNILQTHLAGLNNNLNNLRFLYNDQYVPAWLESINNGIATIWIKMPVSIPANSSIILNLYSNPSLDFDGVYWGEAPQLSSSYGQYDNGANVFNFYDNFAGNTLSNKWNVYAGTPTINNSLLLSGSSPTTNMISTSNFGSSILDWLGYFKPLGYPGYWENSGWYSNTNAQGNSWVGSGNHTVYGYCYFSSSGNVYTTFTSIPVGSSTNYIFSVANDGANAYYLLNYISQTTTYQMNTPTNYIGFRNGSDNTGHGIDVFVQWVRVRAYPPNGVMPTVALM